MNLPVTSEGAHVAHVDFLCINKKKINKKKSIFKLLTEVDTEAIQMMKNSTRQKNPN